MKAAVLEKIGSPLKIKEVETPTPQKGEVLVQVMACAVCRTDLHILDGELPSPKLPLILGHQIVGEIASNGKRFKKETLVGIPWLGGTCQVCKYCKMGRENLCDAPEFTGYTRNGGFAQYTCANEDYIFSFPGNSNPLDAAPLLCAGMIGYRSLKMAGDAKKVGFYGFGAAATLLTQVAVHRGQQVYAFTRKGDSETQALAKKLGAVYAGDSETLPPTPLDAAILFAPVGELVPIALRAVRKGGSVISAGIHMSDLPSFPYSLLFGERTLRSVTNLTRKDGEEFLELAPKIPIQTEVHSYPLEQVNEALADMRGGKITGSAVIQLL